MDIQLISINFTNIHDLFTMMIMTNISEGIELEKDICD